MLLSPFMAVLSEWGGTKLVTACGTEALQSVRDNTAKGHTTGSMSAYRMPWRLQDDSKIEIDRDRIEELDERTSSMIEQLKDTEHFIVSFQERSLHYF